VHPGKAAASASRSIGSGTPSRRKLQPNGERIGRVREVVAKHAVERCDERFAPWRRRTCAEQRDEAAEDRVDAAAHETRDAPDAPVHEAGDSTRATYWRGAEHAGHPFDGVVHRLDEVGKTARGVDGEPARAAQVGQVIPMRRRRAAQWFSTSRDAGGHPA
jgi:hypothetical protein